MATLSEIRDEITAVVQADLLNQAYLSTLLDTRINRAVSSVAAGIRMPNGETSPPLSDLYESGTVETDTGVAYKALPTTYQRNVFYVSDAAGDRIIPARGGSYYDFTLFLNGITSKDLSEAGSVHRVCVKGRNLYYQGIPSASVDLTVNFYRKPVDMSSDSDTPDGLPEHLQVKLIKNYVAREFFADEIKEDFKSDQLRQQRIAWHDAEFYSAMQDLIDCVGYNDNEPLYYAGGGNGLVDAGMCDHHSPYIY